MIILEDVAFPFKKLLTRMIDFKFGELAYLSAEGVLRRPSLSESGGDEIHSPQKNCYFSPHIPFYAWEGRGSDKLLPDKSYPNSSGSGSMLSVPH